jgi:hypothetical protein
MVTTVMKIKRRLRYYGWCFRVWFITKFQDTFVDRIYASVKILFTGEFTSLQYPTGPTYPMKWNQESEDYDQFYRFRDILHIARHFNDGQASHQ